MLNQITIMGRLTRDPELRRTGSGIAVASFTLAVDRDYAEKGQERETDFIDCVAWRQTGEFVSKYFSKGRMAVVSGRLQIRSWTDKDGNNRRTAEVLADHVYFGDSKRDDGGAQGSNNPAPTAPSASGYPQAAPAAPGYAPGYPQAAPAAPGYTQGASAAPVAAPAPGYAAPNGGYQDQFAVLNDDDVHLPF